MYLVVGYGIGNVNVGVILVTVIGSITSGTGAELTPTMKAKVTIEEMASFMVSV